MFFILFIESKIEKLLLLDILVKKAEKKTKNLQSNFFNYIFLLNINKQRSNLKYLKLFPFFMLFWLDFEVRKKILDLKVRKNGLNKLRKDFSKFKHILIFGKSLWFIYKSCKNFEKVAKENF